MFRKIRKVKNEIGPEKIKEILAKAPRGVLALNGDDGYPYGFPLNFVYDEENQSLYFHGTKTGYKIDCIKKNPKACFTVVLEDGLADDGWSKITSSVIAYGLVEEIDDQDFAREALINLAKKYYPNVDLVHENMEAGFKNTKILALHISYMTGKKVNER